jgi:hypothetical protein
MAYMHGNDPVISLHSPHPCGLCRRQSANNRRSKRRRSRCREHEIFKALNFLRALVNNLISLIE